MDQKKAIDAIIKYETAWGAWVVFAKFLGVKDGNLDKTIKAMSNALKDSEDGKQFLREKLQDQSLDLKLKEATKDGMD